VPPSGEEPFRVLFETSPVGMALAAADGTLTAVNPAVCRLWGRAEQDLVGSPGLELVHPDDRAEVAGQLRELLAGRAGLMRREQRFVRPDGSVVWAEWLTQAAGGDGGSPRYLHWVVDVTEGKQAEAARSWMAAVVEASQDAIIGTTLDGVITTWNAGAQRIFGYTAQQMVGRNAAVLRPPGSAAEVARLTRRIGRGERCEYRAVGVRKDGSTVTLLWASAPILDASGAVIGTATVARDLGEQEQAGAMFRSLVEAAPDAMVCADGQGVITLVNAQAERLFGYARGELIGCPVQMLVPEHATGIHPGHRGGYLADPVPRPMGAGQDLTARRKDGSVFPAEISLSSIQTHDGTLVTATVRDGTERQRAAIVASSADAIIGRRLDGTITSWNAGAERMYGYTAGEAIGSTLAMLEPPERSGELAGLTERVRRGEPAGPYETQRVRKDGTRIEVSVTLSPIRDAAEAVVGTSAVARDITASKRALAALRATEARKSAILESALDCWVSMDDQGRVVEFNPAAERVFGYRRDQALGQPLAELIIPPRLREAHRAGLARYLATGEGPVLGQHLELTAIRADGSEFPVELAITKVELPGPPVFTGCLRDLTDRKKAEQEQQALGERLRQSERLQSLGQLAGGVAHDFNNLLGVILNNAAFLAEWTAGDPHASADVEQIRAAAEQGARLTRQLLIVGRREAVRPAILDLNAVVADVRDLLSRSIGEHVQLAVRPAAGLPAIRADRGQVEQVLLNLAVNARDAMPHGGTLTITTSVTVVDEDYLRLHPGATLGRHVELAVSDTGIGIPPEIAAHIFEPFFTTKPQGQGTGLGLATVYGIVTEAGGHLSVYSEPGIGTTFRVLFPARTQPAAAATTPAATGDVEGHGETILVVEDDAAMMELTARILRRHGYTVAQASTGAQALAEAASPGVRLLLTDSVMPHMSGPELAQQIRTLRPGLPVLFMSGYAPGVFGTQQTAGHDAPLIQKPFNAHTLLTHVKTAITHTSGDPPPPPP
jgi:two-component system, cell cycle sensor histidine kinase and response regulator CckA